MCGRFTLTTPALKLMELFQLTEFPELEPRYNIAPTQLVICIRQVAALRRAVPMRWGLVPFWAKDVSIGNRMINARSETVAEKPAFRRAFRSQRCLIPTDGFYEWEKLANRKKQPWLIHLPEDAPFAFAGLWESWQPATVGSGATPEKVLSCTLLTTEANADMAEIHDRMPVILSEASQELWLNNSASPGQLSGLMKPLSDGVLQRRPMDPLKRS